MERAVFAAPIGKAAARIYDAAAELHEALHQFVESYPDNAACQAAAGAAILAAGLTIPDRWDSHGPTIFEGVPREAEGWAFLLNVIVGVMENCAAPPGLEDEEDEPEAAVSAA
jgi:hypothetical protein